MKPQHRQTKQADRALRHPSDKLGHSAGPCTDQRASPSSATDAQYGTRSSVDAAEHANASAARSDKQPTRGGAQTGLTGSVGNLDAATQSMQRPGGANPSAQSNADWQAQRGDEPTLPDAASEQARTAAASPGRVSQGQDRGLTIDRGEQVNLDQPRATQGGAYPGQGPGEAHGASKYNPTANEQDRLSRHLGGAALRDEPPLEDAPSADAAERGKAQRRRP